MSDPADFDGLTPPLEKLTEFKPNLRPTPPPQLPPQHQVSSTNSKVCRRRFKREKPEPRKADSMLLNHMSDFSQPNVAAQAAVAVLDCGSGSEVESTGGDEEMEDIVDVDTRLAAQMEADEKAALGKNRLAETTPDSTGPTAYAQKALGVLGTTHPNGRPNVPDRYTTPKSASPDKRSPSVGRSPPADGIQGLCINGIPGPLPVMEPQTPSHTEPFPNLSAHGWEEEPHATSPRRSWMQPGSPDHKLPALQHIYSSPRAGPGSPQSTKLPPINSVFKDLHSQREQQRLRSQSASSALASPSPAYPVATLSIHSPHALPSALSHTSPTFGHSAMSPPSASGLPSSFGALGHARRASQPSDVASPYPPHSASTTYSASTTESHTSGSDAFSPQSAAYPTPSEGPRTINSSRRSTDLSHRGSINGLTPIAVMSPITPQMSQHTSPKAGNGPTLATIQHIPAHGTEGFKCTYAGCTAAPFQTQYLLNSHKTVHSTSRPHYCPIPNCPRSVIGKGFKRKNEMIRHGLVHESPGYICPFCPDREHRYPRPDNLQRHVRAHHGEDKKDDPLLRAVLEQRGVVIGSGSAGGGGRGRRRRNTLGS